LRDHGARIEIAGDRFGLFFGNVIREKGGERGPVEKTKDIEGKAVSY
jgi:hypothetical protein